jgi:hypothetical protein
MPKKMFLELEASNFVSSHVFWSLKKIIWSILLKGKDCGCCGENL